MDGTAIIFTHGLLHTLSAKTAHGLIRGSDRYDIRGVIDPLHAGRDAGEVFEQIHRGIPVFADLSVCLAALPQRPDFFIIGIASAGGRVLPEWLPLIREALAAGLSVVNGLHDFLSDMPDLVALAQAQGCSLVDVRKPKPRAELHFWSGEIDRVGCPIVAVLGTDCAVGKRTTARILTLACREAGLRAEMIYTGQTGWMQGWRYGFIFDSTLNDFVSGELEHAIVRCWGEARPDIIFIEGQSALRNPSGPCGSEMLVSGRADAAVLVHPPGRVFFKGWEDRQRRIPPLREEIALVRMYGCETLGIALNTLGLTPPQVRAWQRRYEEELGLPVVSPLDEGVAALMPHIWGLIRTLHTDRP